MHRAEEVLLNTMSIFSFVPPSLPGNPQHVWHVLHLTRETSPVLSCSIVHVAVRILSTSGQVEKQEFTGLVGPHFQMARLRDGASVARTHALSVQPHLATRQL